MTTTPTKKKAANKKADTPAEAPPAEPSGDSNTVTNDETDPLRLAVETELAEVTEAIAKHENAKAEAREIVQKARQQAADLRSNAQAELDRLRPRKVQLERVARGFEGRSKS